MIAVIKRRVRDLAAELSRVDWPTKEKVKSSTIAVVVVSILAGAYLWAADVFFTWLTKFLLPR